MRKFTIYGCNTCENTGQRGSKYFKKMGNEIICLTCDTSLHVHILQHESYDEELCENKCAKIYDCCDCGCEDGDGCGCAYCWSCNACEDCLSE